MIQNEEVRYNQTARYVPACTYRVSNIMPDQIIAIVLAGSALFPLTLTGILID
jgi:hypothetical protein